MRSKLRLTLDKARKKRNDEFFTRYEDVEKEIEMYPMEIWDNKSVLCNCNDRVGKGRNVADTSAFALYFIQNFKRLNLKKLVCTQYPDGGVFIKGKTKESISYLANYDGDFAHPHSMKLLEEADIVCTNPPFSLAKKYWEMIVNSEKKFLILSNMLNPVKGGYIPFFIKGQVRPGYFNQVHKFLAADHKIIMGPGAWYTNFEIKHRPNWKNLKIMPLNQIPPKYIRKDDNGILSFTHSYIPLNYRAPFAVGAGAILNGILEKGYKIIQEKRYDPCFKGRHAFSRVLIQKINNASIKEVA